MKDETYAFVSDVKEKKITARSARHTRTHCGKGGRVRLPSDHLSKKELQKMNGECKSYRLNEPMPWVDFKKMPDDIQVTYITALRKKYSVSDAKLAEMFGVSKDVISRQLKRLGLDENKTRKRVNWDKDGFYAWWHGVGQIPVPVDEEEPAAPKAPADVSTFEIPDLQEAEWIQTNDTFDEDDLPFEEPATDHFDEITDLKTQIIQMAKENEELKAVNEKAMAENDWLRNELENQRMNARILEAQMEVVRLIFGGKNNA